LSCAVTLNTPGPRAAPGRVDEDTLDGHESVGGTLSTRVTVYEHVLLSPAVSKAMQEMVVMGAALKLKMSSVGPPVQEDDAKATLSTATGARAQGKVKVGPEEVS